MQPLAPQPHAATAPAGPSGPWHLRLLGAMEARRDGQLLTRWPSRAASLLLARLALAPQRAHPREELVELLWPGVPLAVGRNRLRQTLSTLKTLLESAPGSGLVIDADRQQLRLVAGALHCDAVAFEQQVRSGDWTSARTLYGGDLLPGHYDDWVLESRAHLAALFERVEAHSVPEPAPMPLPPADELPASWTRVFGIEHRATRLLALLRHERLVNVVGPGGCGKTRLTLEAARALRDGPAWSLPPDTARVPPPRFARIVFVPLAECVDEAQAVAALARALHLTGADPLQQARAQLAGAPVLLVLDNFEQLVASARQLPLKLLEAVPSLHLVVTSRLRLDLPGEQVFTLGGLPLPEPEAETRVDSALLNPSVALFVDRARAVRPDYHLASADLAVVCALVRWLDGMPLALELAASRVGSYAPAQLLRLLSGDGPLQLLSRSAPRAGHDPRQASMERVIDWSWRLLSPAEQAVLAALSGFAGDAGLPGLAAVLNEPAAGVAARLDDLAGHSLLRPTAPAGQGGAPRFMLTEPVREFVRSRWPPADLARLQQAAHDWLLHWARGLGPTTAATAVEPELRSVLSLLVVQPRGPRGALDLALALRPYWDAAGMPSAQQAALEEALAALSDPGLAPQGMRCEAHELLAYLRFEAGYTAQARAHADAAVALSDGWGSTNDASRLGGQRARALVRRAWVDLAAGPGSSDDPQQLQRLQGWLHEALALGRAAGDREAQARALHQQAVIASSQLGDWAGAEALLAESESLWLALGDRRKAYARLRNRGQCWLHLGRSDEAQVAFERCERAAQEQGDWVGRIDCLLSLSSLLSQRRQWQTALDLDRRCVALCWQRWHRHGLGYALWNPPRSLARLRRPEPAMRLMAFAASYWQTTFGPLGRNDRLAVRRVRGLVRAQVGDRQAQAWWDEGETMDIASAVALALQA